MSESRTEQEVHSPERSKKRSPAVPRSPNWCMSEIRVLCEYIRQHSTKILGSATDGPGRNAQKQKHWEKVTKLINERYGQSRVWKQVRKKWVDLTYMAKSYKRNNRVQDSGCATSDGSSDDDNLTPVIREVLLALENPPKRQSQEFCNQEKAETSLGSQAWDRNILQDNGFPALEVGDMSSDSDSEPDFINFTSSAAQRRQVSPHQRRRSDSNHTSQNQRRLRSRHVVSQTASCPGERSNLKDWHQLQAFSRNSANRPTSHGEDGRQRLGGARTQLSPYPTSKPLHYWKERFSAIDRMVSRSDPTEEKELGDLRSFQSKMLEIEREKVSTAKAKLAVMQENLVLKKEELNLQKSLLFYVKSISQSRNGFMPQRRHLRDHCSNVSPEKYATSGLWDPPCPGQPFQNDLYRDR